MRHCHQKSCRYKNLHLFRGLKGQHCVKSVHIRSFSGPNAGKYGPDKLRIRTPFPQCRGASKTLLNINEGASFAKTVNGHSR